MSPAREDESLRANRIFQSVDGVTEVLVICPRNHLVFVIQYFIAFCSKYDCAFRMPHKD